MCGIETAGRREDDRDNAEGGFRLDILTGHGFGMLLRNST